MKRLILLLLWPVWVGATTYTVGTGGDFATWGDVTWGSINAGDVLDGQGETFNERIDVGADGASGNPIVLQNFTLDGQDTLATVLTFYDSAAADPTLGPPSNNDDDRYGDYNALRINSSGQISTTLQAGEDQTNDVQKIEHQYNVCIDDADKVYKSSAGFLHSVWCYGEDTAATAGSVRVTNTTAAGGAETTEVWGADIPAAAFKTQGEVLDIIMDTGIVIDSTTTADVKCGVSYR